MLLGVTGVCIQNSELSSLRASKTFGKADDSIFNGISYQLRRGYGVYPIDTLRRMYFLESHVTKV